MRRLSLFALACSLLLVNAACSNTTSTNGNSGMNGSDAASDDSQTSGDIGNDTATGTDAATNDTGSAGTDAIDDKASGTDATELTDADAQSPDTDLDIAIDIDSSDTATDLDIAIPDVPDVKPGSCTTDKDCLGLNFVPCQIGYCDTASQMCKVKPAADGVACSVGGPCGGPGVCKSGSCDAPTTCKPDVCSPQEVTCGSKIIIELATLGESKFSGYGNCSSNMWAGPEAAVLLASDVTMTATLSIDTTGVTADVQIFDVAPTLDGKCDTAACDDSSYYSLDIGLPAGVPRILIIDSSAADTGTVTLTVECTITTVCGDGTCDATETCGSCSKDCGACTNSDCGNGTCDITENCLTCSKDCGTCVAGCTKTADPGCGGCACEAEVCAADSYCCSNHWDGSCVSECAATKLITCPAFNDVCGDGICGANEFSSDCPNDCGGSFLYCGDGICSASEQEDCKGCSQDCGFCLTPGLSAAGCGDGKCSGDESCVNCAADCGKCGDYSCACLEDPSCCTKEFGYYCQDLCNTCIAGNGGGSCPVSNCGDGICAGETCSTCSSDCGKCPAYCGDGTCDPGEDKANCPADCSVGCLAKCGKKSKEADGTACWCDNYCASAGDCCSDKATFCP